MDLPHLKRDVPESNPVQSILQNIDGLSPKALTQRELFNYRPTDLERALELACTAVCRNTQ
jgi:hypothetical protein